MNAHTDYRYKYGGGAWLQHLTRMPGDMSSVYTPTATEGILHLTDTAKHVVKIEVRDAAQNVSAIRFPIQYDRTLSKTPATIPADKLIPGYVNVFEEEDFEVFTTDRTVYDTVPVQYKKHPVLQLFFLLPFTLSLVRQYLVMIL
jgi:hypothetical protein